MKKIAIIGSGSWGVALAIHLNKLGNQVKIWSFAEEEANLINNEHTCKFLPQVKLSSDIYCTTSYEQAIKDSDLIFHVTPSKFTRNIVKEYKKYVTNQPIIVCSKGIETGTFCTLDEVIKQEIPNVKVGVLSGPSHAEEVCMGIPTVLVIASEDEAFINEMQDMLMNENMRIYTSTDVKGVELGGALKNIIALCTGIAAGMGLGDNTFAALITRGLKEMSDLGEAIGAKRETFSGLTGLGDLIATCLSEHSRNRRAGKLIGQGLSLADTKKEVGMTIESIDNIEIAYELGKKYDVELPITNSVYNILYNGLNPKEAVEILMTRHKKSE